LVWSLSILTACLNNGVTVLLPLPFLPMVLK
jgi:hypothetical protein